MKNNIDWYINVAIRHEIESLDDKFTGNIEFRLNFKNGSIANMNCTKNKSIVKLVEK